MVWSNHRLQDLRLRVGWGWDGAHTKARSLQAVPLFAHCRLSELQMLVGLTSEVSVRAGTLLWREGQGSPPQFVILTKGRLEVGSDGSGFQTCQPGSYLPQSGSHLDAADLPTIRAESDAEIIVMNPSEFASMVELVPSVRAQLRGVSPSGGVRPQPPSVPEAVCTDSEASPAGVVVA